MLIVHLPILAMLLTLGVLPNNGYVFYRIRKRCLNKYKLHHHDVTCQVQGIIVIYVFDTVYTSSLIMQANTMAVMMLDTYTNV